MLLSAAKRYNWQIQLVSQIEFPIYICTDVKALIEWVYYRRQIIYYILLQNSFSRISWWTRTSNYTDAIWKTFCSYQISNHNIHYYHRKVMDGRIDVCYTKIIKWIVGLYFQNFFDYVLCISSIETWNILNRIDKLILTSRFVFCFVNVNIFGFVEKKKEKCKRWRVNRLTDLRFIINTLIQMHCSYPVMATNFGNNVFYFVLVEVCAANAI